MTAVKAGRVKNMKIFDKPMDIQYVDILTVEYLSSIFVAYMEIIY